MASLELIGVGKGYGRDAGRVEILRGVDLSLDEGEFVAIVGFSGSGKTTLISLMAGLLAPDAGEIRIAGERVRGPGSDRGVVFQNYSLLPWLTVRGNVLLAVRKAFPDRRRADQLATADRYVDMVGLSAAREKRPRQLSGGMRQRVAVARALAMNPKILLLDEPLGALDALTRATLQREVERIWRNDRKTVVMVTNDVDEAILLSDRIVPLNPGPGATLGPSFPVPLERPRDPAVVGRDPAFKKLRAEVTSYLIEIGRARWGSQGGSRPRRPDVRPRHLPSAVRRTH